MHLGFLTFAVPLGDTLLSTTNRNPDILYIGINVTY